MGGWSTPRPGCLTPGKETRYPFYKRLGGSHGLSVWRGAEKVAPTWIRSPDRPARSGSLYGLRYPGPYSMANREFLKRWLGGWGVKPTNYFHLWYLLRMSVALPPSLHMPSWFSFTLITNGCMHHLQWDIRETWHTFRQTGGSDSEGSFHGCVVYKNVCILCRNRSILCDR